jgi:dTDP-4-dehydrorhamnose reductase
MNNSYIIIGSNGMLGHEFIKTLLGSTSKVIGIDRPDIDITNPESIKVLNQYPGYTIINCAAYTAVDQAEENSDLAFKINSLGARNLAQFCKQKKHFLVHFSTDYVFDGNKKTGYIEDDLSCPIGVYGKSKKDGEDEIKKTLPQSQYLILRTAWLYGKHGKNFVETMIHLSNTHSELHVVGDQYGSPTFTKDLVKWTLTLLDQHQTGFFHTVNQGVCSWADFAQEIMRLSNKQINVRPIKTEDYPTKATRPKYSILLTDKLQMALHYPIRKWDQALSEYLK